MSRPKLPTEALKHPRVFRQRFIRASRLDVKKPSAKTLKRWRPLLMLCIQALLKNDRKDNIGKKAKINIFFKTEDVFPEGWPGGRVVEKLANGVVRAYNAEAIVCWMYERWLCDFVPHDLYAEAREGSMLIRNIVDDEKFLDVDSMIDYNGCPEQGEE